VTRYWTPEETAVIERAAAGEISRCAAHAALPHRSREAIDKKIGRAVGGGHNTLEPRPLAANDPGYEDGEFTARRLMAAEASATMVERIRASMATV